MNKAFNSIEHNSYHYLLNFYILLDSTVTQHYDELGYKENLTDAVSDAKFEEAYTAMVTVRDIEYHSLCEHHLMPFYGKVSIELESFIICIDLPHRANMAKLTKLIGFTTGYI